MADAYRPGSWLSLAWYTLTQACGWWADRVLAGASPTNGSPGLPLPRSYIYMLGIFFSAEGPLGKNTFDKTI
jgi:hypothetical protein